MADLAPRAPERALFPAIVVALAVVPAACWIARDHGVWPWDTAHMGNYAVNLWTDFNPFSGTWWRELLTGMVGKAPGLPWASHPFVGLGQLVFDDALTGLLVFQTLAQVVAALLVWRTAMHMTSGHLAAGCFAACIFVAAPLSMGLSVRYYTETLQTLSVAYLWWAVVAIPSRELTRRFLHAFLAATLGSITKVSTPLYIVVPLGWLVLDSFRNAGSAAPQTEPARRRPPTGLAIIATTTAALSLTWLVLGFHPLVEFVRSTSSGAIASYYGQNAGFVAKLVYWLHAMERELVNRYLLGALAVLLLASAILGRRRRPSNAPETASRPSWWLLAIAQVAVALAVMARQTNQDVRYLEPLLPCLALIGAQLVYRLRPPALAWIAVATGFLQYSTVALQLNGIVASTPFRHAAQVQPPQPDDTGRRLLAHTIAALRANDGADRTYLVAVDVINFNCNALELHTALQRLEGKRAVAFRAGFSPLFADYDNALGRLLSGDNAGIITLPPTAVPRPIGMENQLQPRVFQLLTHDPRFREVDCPGLAPVHLFRLVGTLREGSPPAVTAAHATRPTDHLIIDAVAGRAPDTPAPDRGTFVAAHGSRTEVRGWAYADDGTAPPPQVFLELADAANRHWFAPMSRFSRPDVAATFQQPQLDASGITALLDTTDLPTGRYRLRVLQVAGDTVWEPATAIYWLEVR